MERLTPVVQRAPGRWRIARVTEVRRETPRVKSFRFALPMWRPHLPGQHYDVRLTAPDGYRAQRSYSVARPPLDRGEIELTIDRLDEGGVSTYFHDVVNQGDQFELRGPFAAYSSGGASRRRCSWAAAPASSRSWRCCATAGARCPRPR